MSDLLEFKNQQIEALQKENERLKKQIIETEKSQRISADKLKEIISDPTFNKPIQNVEY